MLLLQSRMTSAQQIPGAKCAPLLAAQQRKRLLRRAKLTVAAPTQLCCKLGTPRQQHWTQLAHGVGMLRQRQ